MSYNGPMYGKYRDAEGRKKYLREWRLMREYNLTADQYDAILKSQGGKCACCRSPDYGKPLAVDHCHTTGKVRGLLCHTCNNHLGIYERRRAEFEEYLRRYE